MAETGGSKVIDRVVIRPLSPIIYLYPSLLAAIICGCIVHFGTGTLESPGATGIVFSLVFFFNLSIMAFDYTRMTSIALVLVLVIVGLLAAMYPQVGEFLRGMLNQPMFMNSTFYFVWSICLGLLLLIVLVKTRFDYWEISNNEVIHYQGMMGDVDRWPAANMRLSKEIKDVLEYVLVRAGRLVIVPSSNDARAIVIDNVPNINSVEARMQKLLSALRVADGD